MKGIKQKYKKIILLIMAVFAIFVLSGCKAKEPSLADQIAQSQKEAEEARQKLEEAREEERKLEEALETLKQLEQNAGH